MVQFNGFEARLVKATADAVVKCLKDADKLPRGFKCSGELLSPPIHLHRLKGKLVGRESEVAEVLSKLRDPDIGAAIVRGGPGEGKSMVAMEAARRLWEGNEIVGGGFGVDLQGACCKHAVKVHNCHSWQHVAFWYSEWTKTP